MAARQLAHRLAGRNGPIRTDALPAKIEAVSGRDAIRACLAVTDAAIRSNAPNLRNAARRCLDEALITRSESTVLLSSSAVLRFTASSNDTEKIEAEAKLAITLDPQNEEAANLLAALAALRRDDAAKTWGEKAIAANPFDPAILRAEAQRREAAGDIAKANLLVSQATILEAATDTN